MTFLHASSHAHRRTIRRRQAVIAGLLTLTLTALTAGGDGTARLWNPATGRLVATIRATSVPTGTSGVAQYGVSGVAFSPESKLLVGSVSDGTVRANLALVAAGCHD